jgi:hypothetical protein
LIARIGPALVVWLCLTGCANQAPQAVYGYHAVNGVPNAGGPDEIDTAVEAAQASKKTLAGKVLAAIALERVTGRKPDPARLTELY